MNIETKVLLCSILLSVCFVYAVKVYRILKYKTLNYGMSIKTVVGVIGDYDTKIELVNSCVVYIWYISRLFDIRVVICMKHDRLTAIRTHNM